MREDKPEAEGSVLTYMTEAEWRSRRSRWAVFTKLYAELLEEVITLVINQDERRKVLHADFPDGLHAEVRIFDTLDTLDAFIAEDSRRAADRAEIETAVLLAGIGDAL